MARTLRFGHSPDADDAYMFYGFHTGLAAVEGCRVEHVLEDIQSLNRRALERADLEITAVSAHAYAFLAGRYAVLACGASMGHGVGPVVVAREPRTLESLAGRRVAIPGPMTTAALLLRCECPGCVPVDVMFDRIPADRVVMALKGTDPVFRDMILSSMGARARRMVENELQTGGPAQQRDVLKARRAIADIVLEMAERNEIEINAGGQNDAVFE